MSEVETIQTESVAAPLPEVKSALAGRKHSKPAPAEAAAQSEVVTEAAQEVKAAVKPDVNGNVSINIAELIALVNAASERAATKSAEIIANAIIESRKPYVDPRQAENDKIMRDQMRETQERIRKEIEASRELCPHLQGSNPLSEIQGTLGSFVLHKLDTGETIGICTNCQKIIRSTVAADRQFFQKKNANRMSKSGDRTFLDPMAAQLRGRLVDKP